MKIEQAYNQSEIVETLNKLQLEQKGNNIFTRYDNKLISDSKVSKKYEFFDFSKFATNIVKEIENYFTPENYILRINKGQQELRLIGEEIEINGDKYHKMFNIFNSTDRSRALGLNTGLIRFVCSNGMVIGVEDELSKLSVKHFKSTLPQKVDLFLNSLSNFDININKQTLALNNLNGKYVSYKEIVDKLSKNKNGIITTNKMNKIRAFSKKILISETDRIEDLKKEQIELLNNPALFFEKGYNNLDIEMSAYNALNCYTEVFRNYNSQVIDRETNRILELI